MKAVKSGTFSTEKISRQKPIGYISIQDVTYSLSINNRK